MTHSIALVATHPIQYQVPWFRELARLPDLKLKVYFALLPDDTQQGVGFGVPFQWDIPMLDGYEWELLPNAARRPGLRGFFSSSTPSIRAALERDRPDAVILTGWNALPLLQALRACVALKIPRIVRGESNGLRIRPGWIRLAHRALVRTYDAFLAIGQSNRQFYLDSGASAARIFDCRYFVDNERIRASFDLALPERAKLRSGWGIQDGKYCFLYVGKLEPKKRIFDLLHALQAASGSRDDLHLLVVGAGELLAAAREYSSSRELPVTYAGFLNQTQLAQAYAAGDCLVLPSDYGETWGLVVNEAMACALPVIVSDRVGCGPDLVEAGVTGEIFQYGQPAALATRLVEMAADPARSRAMGASAEGRISRYTVTSAVEGTMQAIDYVLRKGR